MQKLNTVQYKDLLIENNYSVLQSGKSLPQGELDMIISRMDDIKIRKNVFVKKLVSPVHEK